jgi:hypothetical protein
MPTEKTQYKSIRWKRCEAGHTYNDPVILDIVLRSEGALVTSSTIESALHAAMVVPIDDTSRAGKLHRLLEEAKPQQVIDECLLQEVNSAVAQKQNLDVLQTLLKAGANVNVNGGAVIVAALADPQITDMVLAEQPNSRSLDAAFVHAMSMTGLAKYNTYEKLLRAGARGERVDEAFCVAAGEYDLRLLKLLRPVADVNYKKGRALFWVIRNSSLGGFDFLLHSEHMSLSPTAKAKAFRAAMNLDHCDNRNIMITRLLDVQVPVEAISEGLISAVSAYDVNLIDKILQYGPSLDHNNGEAVLCASNSGRADILRLLLQREHGVKPTMPTLIRGFVAARALMERDTDAHFAIVEILLEAGARGEAISTSLIEAVQRGDQNLRMIELFCKHGTSVEWQNGAAIEIAARAAEMKTLAGLCF